MKFPLNRGGGKGDKPRPVDRKKYEESWIRCFGKECPRCKGVGIVNDDVYLDGDHVCPTCNGIGKVEK